MGAKKDISREKYEKVKFFLKNSNFTQAVIADKLNLSQRSVSRIKNKLNEIKISKKVGRNGRNRISSARSDRVLLRLCKNNRKSSSKQLKTMLEDKSIVMSSRTVRRRLFEAGYKAYRPRKRPKLTETMKKKRLAWAKSFENWTVDDWKRVNIYLDSF